MAKSYQNFDKPYRRGLILGLSLAELFLILLFLLLLVSMGISSILEEEKQIIQVELQQLQKEKDTLKDKLATMEEIVGGEITLDELRRLVANDAERRKILRENKELNEKVEQLTDSLSEFKEIKDIIEKENINEKQLQDLIQNNKKLVEVLQEKNKLEEKVNDLSKEIKELESELASEKIQKDILEDKFAQVSEQLDRLVDKGRAPPCWYIVVNDKSEVTGKRQKDVKIFDVKIENDGFVVRPHNNNFISQKINKGNTRALPIFSSDDFNVKLSTNSFISKFKNFYDVGTNKLIHPYKCVFMVDVYDATSIDNKIGYKRNLKTIERLFMKWEESGQWRD